jgi:hypothetical protein
MPKANFIKIAMVLWANVALVSCGDGRGPVTETGLGGEAVVEFVDVAQTAGLDFVHYNGLSGDYFYVETAGSGGGFFDYDGDGWLDIYLVNGAQLVGSPLEHPPINRLFRNRSGEFDDVTAGSGAGDPSYGAGCVAADYDNDGDQDLYVTNFGANVLLQNQKGEHFRNVTTAAGVGESRWSTASGFLDYDGDGDLDLMAVNYLDFTLDNNIVCKQGKHRSYCDPTQYNPVSDVLYRNDGEESRGPVFTDVSNEAGITLKGRGLGIAFSDYDNDGDTDVYIANDKDMNFLYENRRGTFSEVGLQAGTRYNADGLAEAGMGVDFGDVDADGDADLYVSNFSQETNTFYANDGRGEFRDATEAFGLAAASYMPLGFGLRFMDYDDDGYLDLFIANGHVLDNIERIQPELRYAQPNQMMRNLRGRGFIDVSATLGQAFAHTAVSRGAAVGDYDNDGDLDILVTNIADRPNLLRNDGGNRRNWLIVELTGAVHGDAMGARVTVTTRQLRQLRERYTAGSYLSSHDPRLHFGLGAALQADIEITWPDGEVLVIEGVRANQILRVRQRAGY